MSIPSLPLSFYEECWQMDLYSLYPTILSEAITSFPG